MSKFCNQSLWMSGFHLENAHINVTRYYPIVSLSGNLKSSSVCCFATQLYFNETHVKVRRQRRIPTKSQTNDHTTSCTNEDDISKATLLWRAIKLPIYSVALVPLTSCRRELGAFQTLKSAKLDELPSEKYPRNLKIDLLRTAVFSSGSMSLLTWSNPVAASEYLIINPVYEVGELFELGIQLSYLLLLLGLLGVGTFFVIRQVLVRRELDLSAKELQEQVRSGDASSMELFELGAVMLRRKFYPAATKYLLQAIDKWDGDDQDLAQVYNALGVSYVRDGKTDKGISQLETAVKIQPGYVTAWNNLGDAYEKKKDYKAALKAFEEALLFDPNNKLARPRRDALKDKVQMYKGIPLKGNQR